MHDNAAPPSGPQTAAWAAAVAGLSREAAVRRIQTGEWRGYRAADGRYWVSQQQAHRLLVAAEVEHVAADAGGDRR